MKNEFLSGLKHIFIELVQLNANINFCTYFFTSFFSFCYRIPLDLLLKTGHNVLNFRLGRNNMGALGMGIVGGILGLIIFILLGALFLWIAAKIVKIEGASYGKSILVTIVGFIAAGIVNFILAFIPVIGWILGIIVAILVMVFIIQKFFATTFGKAFLVWLIDVVLSIIVGVIFGVIFALVTGGSLLSMMPR